MICTNRMFRNIFRLIQKCFIAYIVIEIVKIIIGYISRNLSIISEPSFYKIYFLDDSSLIIHFIEHININKNK